MAQWLNTYFISYLFGHARVQALVHAFFFQLMYHLFPSKKIIHGHGYGCECWPAHGIYLISWLLSQQPHSLPLIIGLPLLLATIWVESESWDWGLLPHCPFPFLTSHFPPMAWDRPLSTLVSADANHKKPANWQALQRLVRKFGKTLYP